MHRISALCLVVACRCEDTHTRSRPTTTATARDPAQCEYLPESDAEHVLGVAVRYTAADPFDPDAIACELVAAGDLKIVVQVTRDLAAYEFAAANGGEPVANLGDGARWLAGANRLVASQRGRDAGIVVQGLSSPGDARAKAAALLAIVLSRM